MSTQEISKILIMLILLSLGIVSAVRINEVELNPLGEDNGNEWLELYSSEQVNIDNWTIMNAKGKNFTLEGSFSGYYAIITPYAFLTNEKQKLSLLNNKQVIDETPVISDSYNDDKSWQFCSKWAFTSSTKGKENNCEIEEEEETEENINSTIIEKEEKEVTEEVVENKEQESKVIGDIVENKEEENEVIKLNKPKDIKTKESKDKIKEYAIYFFTGFCIFLIVILIWKRKSEF